MGVTIHYGLGANAPYVKGILDDCQGRAEMAAEQGFEIVIRRPSERSLFIDIGDCETLCFEFQTPAEIEAERKGSWSYAWSALTDDGKRPLDPGYEDAADIERYPGNVCLYTADFCKTQFGGAAQHVLVAELLRIVAGRCFMAEVSDEGRYYQSLNFFDVVDAIGETGAIMEKVTAQLRAAGFDVVVGPTIALEGAEHGRS